MIAPRQSGKQVDAILRLPVDPQKDIVWIVYNSDMVEYTRNLIKELRGEDYLSRVKVVARTEAYQYNGHIYFDPLLYDHLGNGNV